MFKTCISCLGALVVAGIIGTLLWRTLAQESTKSTSPVEGILINSPGSKQPIQAFTTTEMLGDYLLAAADHDTATVARLCGSLGGVTLDPGTKAVVQGVSGPGQARVKVTTGRHKGEILFVNYATIQEPGT